MAENAPEERPMINETDAESHMRPALDTLGGATNETAVEGRINKHSIRIPGVATKNIWNGCSKSLK